MKDILLHTPEGVRETRPKVLAGTAGFDDDKGEHERRHIGDQKEGTTSNTTKEAEMIGCGAINLLGWSRA